LTSAKDTLHFTARLCNGNPNVDQDAVAALLHSMTKHLHDEELRVQRLLELNGTKTIESGTAALAILLHLRDSVRGQLLGEKREGGGR
jgi:ABC-type transporter Mla MlaB component